MGCRCSDIVRCNSDIDTVTQIKGYYGVLQSHNSDIYLELSNMSGSVSNAVSPDNILDLSRGIREFNDVLDDNADAMVIRCENQLSKLRRDLSSMQSEDQSYHEELERERE